MQDVNLRQERFGEIWLEDPFFSSLKADYAEFGEWFLRKQGHLAYTFRNQAGLLDGFLYLKIEEGAVLDASPPLLPARRLKIGTFKINPHGTRLGERFIKRAFDIAIENRVNALYVTIFPKHGGLVQLFLRYGFVQKALKSTSNGQEIVLERRLDSIVGDVVRDYPRMPYRLNRHFVLALHPQWHSRLLPDSLLTTESSSILQDVSHTNSIHKIYLAGMAGINQLRRGDTLLIYRTASNGPGYYTSVITSLCVVEEVGHCEQFSGVDEFLAYCSPYSVFSEEELRSFYSLKRYPWIIKFTYNLALTRRPTRQKLIGNVGLNPNIYWGFFQITSIQLKSILEISGDYEKASALIYPS